MFVFRYMHGRGCTKRHTVGCTDDLSAGNPGTMEPPQAHSPAPSTAAAAGGGGRTRRTGLLTVMERPPGKPMETFGYIKKYTNFRCRRKRFKILHALYMNAISVDLFYLIFVLFYFFSFDFDTLFDVVIPLISELKPCSD